MKLAMVFPGQGSQSVGMLKGYAGLSAIDEVRAEALAALGEDFLKIIDEGPAEALSLTVNTQPAMVTAGYRGLSRVACAWRACTGARRRAQPRRVFGAGRGRGYRFQGRCSARSSARCCNAGGRAGR